jgi:hypothetical protein
LLTSERRWALMLRRDRCCLALLLGLWLLQGSVSLVVIWRLIAS